MICDRAKISEVLFVVGGDNSSAGELSRRRMRELVGKGGELPGTDAPLVVPSALPRGELGLKNRVTAYLRAKPFWRRSSFVERKGRFGGVQVVIGTRGPQPTFRDTL